VGDVIQLSEHKLQWKQVFQSFSEDTTLNVFFNRFTGACHLHMINDHGDDMAISIDRGELQAFIEHIDSCMKNASQPVQTFSHKV
jgi:hypothetical protein